MESALYIVSPPKQLIKVETNYRLPYRDTGALDWHWADNWTHHKLSNFSFKRSLSLNSGNIWTAIESDLYYITQVWDRLYLWKCRSVRSPIPLLLLPVMANHCCKRTERLTNSNNNKNRIVRPYSRYSLMR